MRRKVGIVVGACAAVFLAAGVTAVAVPRIDRDEDRPVGTWHEPPGRAESAGRQVGALLTVDKPVGYGRQTFRYPGASYVKVHFSRMVLPAGDHLTVSGGKDAESHRYDTSAAAGTWAMSVTGDTAVLEVHRGSGAGRLDVRVDKVARGFPPAPARTGREESVCAGDQSVNAVCYRSADPVAYTRSKAIARLLIDGTELCTGWRVGPNNRMLTNSHCLNGAKGVLDAEVWFNYQCVKCAGTASLAPVKVRAAKVLATNAAFDYTLFTLADFGRVRKFGHLGLDLARPARGQELYVPQHPSGGPAKIAGARGDRAGTCEVGDNAYDGYAKDTDISYLCDTEGGSSGSPVLSRKTDKVVALHHFGGCPNSGVRGDLLYAKLKSLL